MTDIITTPAVNESSGAGALIGGIVFVVFALLFIFYGIPALRGITQTPTPQSEVTYESR